MLKSVFLSSVFLFSTFFAFSQTSADSLNQTGDLAALLEEENHKPAQHPVSGTFETTRIGNGHSVENLQQGILDFRISHRFGYLNQGIKDFFGLDNATTRIGVDYGITDWLMAGLGRSSYLKEYDGFVKLRLLQQKEHNGFPLAISYAGAASVQTYERPGDIPATMDYFFSNRLAFVNQILVARKFNERFSLQLMPTHVHYNMVTYTKDKNDVLALGIGGKIRLSPSISFTAEYFYQVPDFRLHDPVNADSYTKNALTLGFDIETGGHVFQLLFSNATGISERNVIGQTTGDWGKGDVHFGFNISRVFTVVQPKEFKNTRNKIW